MRIQKVKIEDAKAVDLPSPREIINSLFSQHGPVDTLLAFADALEDSAPEDEETDEPDADCVALANDIRAKVQEWFGVSSEDCN